MMMTAYKALSTEKTGLNIPPGTLLKMKIEGIDIPIKIQASLVGMVKNEYILITHPTPLATTKPKLYAGNGIIAQYQDGSDICVFGVKIIDAIMKPIRVVVLEYPDKIIRRKIRSES